MARGDGDGVMVRGAPPRRPGRGGGQRWRRMDEGERCVPGPIQKIGCARDFVPLLSAATVALWPSSSQLSTQEDPFFI